ncbi:carotenoid biosynthesis protein [bacterium]|nr:carotenoid biosynthesis protein [bacterium]
MTADPVEKPLHTRQTKITTLVSLYLLLCAGGLWHVLGWFQPLMRALAAPMLFSLAVLLFLACARRKGVADSSRWALFSIGVIVSAFFLEWFGVHSGKVFGPYAYGQVLQPQLLGVPVVIGCAWLTMILSSAGVMEWLVRRFGRTGPALFRSAGGQVILIALLMVFFDWVMEPAAVKLDYWRWLEEEIPLQNYSAWIIFSLLYAAAALRLGLLKGGCPALARHVWAAQVIYFLLVRLR